MKIIQGEGNGSRLLRLEKAVKTEKSGKKEELGPPTWAEYDSSGRWKKRSVRDIPKTVNPS